jgi:hypothetical protein
MFFCLYNLGPKLSELHCDETYVQSIVAKTFQRVCSPLRHTRQYCHHDSALLSCTERLDLALIVI